MADRRRPRERPPGAAELALPAVRERERVGLARIVGREAGERPQPLALGRSGLDRPGQPGERPPRRVPAHVVRVEELADGLPERARLARRAVVRGGLAHERQQPPRPRAGGVEEIAVAARSVGPLQPGAARRRRAPGASRRRRTATSGARRGSDPCSRPITKTASKLRVRARVRSSTATRPGSPAASPRTVARSRAERTSSAWIGDAGLAQPLELVEDPAGGVGGAEVALRGRRHGRRAEPVGVAQHRVHDRARGRERLVLRGDELEHRQRAPGAQLRRLLDRAVAAEHGPPAQAALEEVDVRRGRGRRTGCGGTRRARGGCRCSTRSGAARAAPARTPSRRAAGAPRSRPARRAAPKAVSIEARDRSSDGQTTAISSGAVPSRTSSSTVSATSSSVARRPAPSRKRIEPSSAAGSAPSSKRWRSRCASPGGR